jgi:hypothetical protein
MLTAIDIMEHVTADTPEALSRWRFRNLWLLIALCRGMARLFSEVEYLDVALDRSHQEEEGIPRDDGTFGKFPVRLNMIYQEQYVVRDKEEDFDGCLKSGQEIVKYSANIHDKYDACIELSQLLVAHQRLGEAFECLQLALRLMPLLVRPSGARDDQEYRLINAGQAGLAIGRYTSEDKSDESLEARLSPA